VPELEARDVDLQALPDTPAVFAVWTAGGPPYLGRTSRLRRRLARLLGQPAGQSRRLSLAGLATRLEYHLAGSAFESSLGLYLLARRYRLEDYRRFLKLRIPPFVKLNLANPYPRCYLTRRLSRDRALYFGPFTSRVAAERFQSAFLDLFLIRRCQEEIRPDPAHPGCIYGEMHMCLRPCQGAASLEAYRAETGRVASFLSSRGESLLKEWQAEREQSSAGLEFEQAARVHKRIEKAQEALKLNEELARDLDRFYGLVIQRSTVPEAVEMWLICQGFLQKRQRFALAAEAGRPVSLDQRLRETLSGAAVARRSARERAEHLALLVRWHASSWKTGELLLFDGLDQVPYRKLVRAVSRVASGQNLESTSSTRRATPLQ
jgi:excinuclease UvrABC nuclease subunit